MFQTPRERKILACQACRVHKQGCDRQKPRCSRCSNLGRQCVYQRQPDTVDGPIQECALNGSVECRAPTVQVSFLLLSYLVFHLISSSTKYYRQTASESVTTASGLAPDTDTQYPVPAVAVLKSDVIASTPAGAVHELESRMNAITATTARPVDSPQKGPAIPANPHGTRGS
ncbi:hypothetical protein ASPVEDRAFT_151709 [Aspergillus versicolor CBS 583.65]|uniref:Zn(2)-C6 fungal-type domain-containing protein n=1 Tax=Aspergillus versicolor CBS 583.65 TaxID=1036611 RepID=A0A1L9PNR1_ASPVE|nr:uncharacterized protein ASPVEDRAFT_151709 [Aspergillus versicolor CBS 583.65]OJJ03160.1 hypothetical protein ASPVEDRAFT_151709 [Aspergillus versicolor CBS 583.65]